MILGFAVIGAIVGFIPGGSFFMIPMEVFLIYKIASNHNAFHMGEFLGMAVALVTISAFLKGLASFLQPIPLIGQLANSLVAFGFILAVGYLAEHHYSSRKA